MKTLESLIEEGITIRESIKFIPPANGIIRTYRAYALSDTKFYGIWKNRVIRYFDTHFPGNRCIDDFEKAILEFEKRHFSPSLFDMVHGILISCQEIETIEKGNSNNNTPIITKDTTNDITTSRKIFIVHGHDNEMKLDVARLLERLDFEPIILSEQPEQGRTIIEKFEEESDVEFAVVLLSAEDDIGAKKGSSNFQPRARQNVILELGYFIGKLGRKKHVYVLKNGNVEVPTDIHGIVYKPYSCNDDGWKLALAKELKSVGYSVNLDRI